MATVAGKACVMSYGRRHGLGVEVATPPVELTGAVTYTHCPSAPIAPSHLGLIVVVNVGTGRLEALQRRKTDSDYSTVGSAGLEQ